jgi:spore maturation protein CgeB
MGAVRFVIFGLTISSAWANGHATPWRGLLKALHRAGHPAMFFERDVEYYAQHRDLNAPDFCELVLYSTWQDIETSARRAIENADVAIVTSYCPDGLAACRLVLGARPQTLRAFYDLDTPITLQALADCALAIPNGARYLTPDLIPEFDLYLSFTGGPILDALQTRWRAKRAAALYGSVDPELHTRIAAAPDAFRCALGYLGTYAADRQHGLQQLLIEPARKRPSDRFLVVGSLYPPEIAWPSNVATHQHLEPPLHPAFYSANRLTLSVTRQAMREWGYTPSGRLFEAAACGTPILSDPWPGIEKFFEPGSEILVAETSEQADAALQRNDAELQRIGNAARERTLASHTGTVRAQDLIAACEVAAC